MSYLVGIDIGGTFTDCAIVDRGGRLLTTKVLSTPPDFAKGMLDALGAGAQALGVPMADFCRDIDFLSGGDLQKLIVNLMGSAGQRLPEFRKVVLDTYF